LSRIEEDGRNWLRRPNLCIKRCRAIRRRRRINTQLPISAVIRLKVMDRQQNGVAGFEFLLSVFVTEGGVWYEYIEQVVMNSRQRMEQCWGGAGGGGGRDNSLPLNP
jgi:hypothetical protein